MKNLKNKLISYALAVIMAFTVSVSFKKYAPITALAASNEQFLSDVALVYKDSVEEAQAAIEGTDWKLYDKDLNPNADYIFDDGVYLIYKTSTDVEDAITDLRVMDMYGGYSATSYKQQIEKSRKDYDAKIDELRVAANEFRTLFYAEDGMARLAYRQMNVYKDVKTENGTETDMKMGDFFLNLPTNNQIIQVLFEGNGLIVSNLISLLAIGISGASGTTLSTRIAEAYANKDNLSAEDYHEDAVGLAKSFDTIKSKINRYEALKEQYDFNDDNMTEEEFVFISEYAAVAELVATIQYGNQTLADFIKGEWATKDLYPIIAAFTPGQKALVEMGQLETVLKYNSPSKPVAELTKMVEEMEEAMKDENGNLSVFNVYTGVDREIFKGDFAMTNAAERQQALTGETWGLGDAASRDGYEMIGYIVAASVDAVMIATVTGVTWRGVVLEAAAKEVMKTGTHEAYGAAAAKYTLFSERWAGVQLFSYYGAIALTIIILGSYAITTWYNYYNPDYLEIPTTLIDVKETDLGDKYVKYSAAKVFNGEEGQEVADFNAYEGKEWIALYYTKDANAGNCLTPNFVYRENNNTVAKRHQGVSMFGEEGAYNLNSHVYNGDADGIYLSVRYSTKKKVAENMPTVVGTMLGGAYYLLTAVGGAGVGIGAMALIQHFRKKKNEEVIAVDETTTGE